MKIEKCIYCFNDVKINTPISMAGHLARCKVWNEKRKKILQSVTKEFLYEHHVVKSITVWEISKMLGLKHTRELKDLLKKFDIPYSNFFNNKQIKQRTKEKRKATNREIYGCDFGLSNKKVRQKIEKTCLKKYGVKNVFASDEIKRIIEQVSFEKYGTKYASSSPIIREKVKNTLISKYGVDSVMKVPEIKKLISEKRQKTGYSPTSKNAEILFSYLYACLKERYKKEIYYLSLNEELSLNKNFSFSSNNKEFGKKFGDDYFYYDFVLSELKFCVEYNGDYYHCNPRIYKPDFKMRNFTAKEIWEKDVLKLQPLHKLGFDVWIIWESDYIHATDFYIFQILWRINYLSNHPNAPRIIFESNIERDNKTYRTQNFIWESYA